MTIKKIGTLEIDQDLKLTRKLWKVQRAGRGLMVLFILAAVAGLVGPGPLSHKKYEASDGSISFESDRFSHYQAPLEIKAEIKKIPENGVAKIWFSKEYLENKKIESIVPEPDKTIVKGDRYEFVFNTEKGQGESVVRFLLETEDFGPQKLVAGLDGAGQIEARHFVFP